MYGGEGQLVTSGSFDLLNRDPRRFDLRKRHQGGAVAVGFELRRDPSA